MLAKADFVITIDRPFHEIYSTEKLRSTETIVGIIGRGIVAENARHMGLRGVSSRLNRDDPILLVGEVGGV